MLSNPVVWFEIYVQDMDRAIKFYESVFETKLQQLNSPFPEFELWSFARSENQYGANGALVKMAGVSPGGNNAVRRNRNAVRRNRRAQ
jgi:predicted enzyme related to lactoylglutathione lyase